MQEHNYVIFNCVSNCDGVINIKLFFKSNFFEILYGRWYVSAVRGVENCLEL